MSTDPTARQVLEFWFGTYPVADNPPQSQLTLWFSEDSDFDRSIENLFSNLHTKASRGELRGWENDHLGRLALVILLDQFSRNLYRNSPLAYRSDRKVQGWVKEWLAAGITDGYSFVEKVFLYLPLEHSEQLQDQEKSVQLFQKLREIAPVQSQEAGEHYLNYAKKHHQVIARFGRFPHRNHVLGRPSTAAEEEFFERRRKGILVLKHFQSTNQVGKS